MRILGFMRFFLIGVFTEGFIEHWLSLNYASDCHCASLVNDELVLCLERSVGSGACQQYDVTDQITYTSLEDVCATRDRVTMNWNRNHLMAEIAHSSAFLKRLQFPGIAFRGCNATRITWLPRSHPVSIKQESFSSSASEADATTEISRPSEVPVTCYLYPASPFESCSWAVVEQRNVLIIEFYGAVMIPSGLPFIRLQVELSPDCGVAPSEKLDHYKIMTKYDRTTRQFIPASARKVRCSTGVMLALTLFLSIR